MEYFLIAGGKTGGHLFPGIAVAEALIKLNPNLKPCFIGVRSGIEEKVIPKAGYRLEFITGSGFYGKGWFGKIKSLAQLPLSILQAFYYIYRYRPRLVIGVGGYSSFAQVLVAIITRRKVVILEQNSALGLVNRILGRFVDRLFLAITAPGISWRNIRVWGNPLRQEIAELASSPVKNPATAFQLFVYGGSQGARLLNSVMPKVAAMLKEEKLAIKIVHQTGQRDYQAVAEGYRKAGYKDYQLLAFSYEMAKFYQSSWLIICRAGSGVYEIAAIGRASILVPITKSSGDHQLKNAQLFANRQAAWLVTEAELSPQRLFELIKYGYNNRSELQTMAQSARALYKRDSAQKIAEECLKLIPAISAFICLL